MDINLEACKKQLIVKGWYQKDVARKTGWSRSAVAKFFRGETVGPVLAHDIIRSLGLDPQAVVLDRAKRRKV